MPIYIHDYRLNAYNTQSTKLGSNLLSYAYFMFMFLDEIFIFYHVHYAFSAVIIQVDIDIVTHIRVKDDGPERRYLTILYCIYLLL